MPRLIREQCALASEGGAAEARASRSAAHASRTATEVPLRTARAASEVLGFLEELARTGNPSVLSDAATGAHLAYAAIKGAQYNVLANLPGLDDPHFGSACRNEIGALVEFAQERRRRIDDLVAVAASEAGSIQ
jgi:glutamate formiminotransferase/formiminotetrahydrofolate cyclodeaminase